MGVQLAHRGGEAVEVGPLSADATVGVLGQALGAVGSASGSAGK